MDKKLMSLYASAMNMLFCVFDSVALNRVSSRELA